MEVRKEEGRIWSKERFRETKTPIRRLYLSDNRGVVSRYTLEDGIVTNLDPEVLQFLPLFTLTFETSLELGSTDCSVFIYYPQYPASHSVFIVHIHSILTKRNRSAKRIEDVC